MIPLPFIGSDFAEFKSQAISWMRSNSVFSRAITASDTVDKEKIYRCDATGGVITLTIPLATAAGQDREFWIEKTDAGANAVNITFSGSDTTTAGGATIALAAQGDTAIIVSDGVSKWSVFQS